MGVVSQEEVVSAEVCRNIERELKETRILLAEKNETANVFMNQVKKLQSQLAGLTHELESWRKAASPVTDNPKEDAFYEE